MSKVFSSDFRRVAHNDMAVESCRHRRCELDIKGRPNRSMVKG